MLGVRLVELDVALRTGDTGTATVLTYRIESLLDAGGPLDLVDYYAGPGSIRDGFEHHTPAAPLLALNAEADELLAPGPERDDPGFVDGTYFALGKWAAAAQLAAAVGDLDWFTGPAPAASCAACARPSWKTTSPSRWRRSPRWSPTARPPPTCPACATP